MRRLGLRVLVKHSSFLWRVIFNVAVGRIEIMLDLLSYPHWSCAFSLPSNCLGAVDQVLQSLTGTDSTGLRQCFAPACMGVTRGSLLRGVRFMLIVDSGETRTSLAPPMCRTVVNGTMATELMTCHFLHFKALAPEFSKIPLFNCRH